MNELTLIKGNRYVDQNSRIKMGAPPNGFASQWFQLTIEEILAEEEGVVLRVKRLMTNIRPPPVNGNLEENCILCKIARMTRDGFLTYKMVLRHLKQRNHVLSLDAQDIEPLLLRP